MGTVAAIENYGAGDIVEIEKLDKKRLMVPMIAAAVPEWDEHRLVISADFID